MAIVRRNNSFYVVHRDPETGRQKWHACGQGMEGEKKAHQLNDELKAAGTIRPYQPQPPAMEAPTFGELASEYIKARKAHFDKPSLYNLYRKLKAVILPEIGHLPATRITARTLDLYINRRSAQSICKRIGKNGHQRLVPVLDRDGRPRTVKTTTIHRELSDIIAILNWAADPGRAYIAVNPVAGYKKPRRDDELITPPTQKEAAAILAHLPEHAVRALTISFYTGVRPGRELFGICWHDCDFDQNTLLVRSAKKGGPPYRILPMNDVLRDHLKRWQSLDEAEEGRGPHIIQFRGKAVRSIKKAFATAKKAAGITRRLRLYDFRHAFATDLINAGADIKSVSYLMGHSRPDTTARVYIHTNMENLRSLVNKKRGV
jgi:integrase